MEAAGVRRYGWPHLPPGSFDAATQRCHTPSVATSDPNPDELRLELAEARAEQDLPRASRARMVQAADAERLRLERNLHDGAQQRLVSLLLTLRLIERSLAGREEVAERIESAAAELALALEELRELARACTRPC